MTDIVDQWALVEADLHSHFGIDVWDDDLMKARPWVWLQERIFGLLSANTRIQRWANRRAENARPAKNQPVKRRTRISDDMVDLGL